MLKVLNLYAGIGGNRKLWQDVEVTAIEIDSQIAGIYKDFFPNDRVIIADAHKYLLENYSSFDFIWSSPPCQSHSRLRRIGVLSGQNKPIYPDLNLYEEILFLRHFCQSKFIIENVIPYYKVLIKPIYIHRHAIWANFPISNYDLACQNIEDGNISVWQKRVGFDISKYKLDKRKSQVLKNCIDPKLGLHIFKSVFKVKQMVLQ